MRAAKADHTQHNTLRLSRRSTLKGGIALLCVSAAPLRLAVAQAAPPIPVTLRTDSSRRLSELMEMSIG
ncbi:hypothetical protein C8J27_102347 [Rhodobacter aestuarii]|uniref:Uncharacterized protein n=1 Tax=Rhodobacter aestuarii TaxID=453582 RepID=A0A1N7MTF6_9RHOB|nr:hypothetical protein [Rhodobacter aestuarii]PTV96548.1 hypothetical protein C8J27_102347 [Rhodobacter aestuarii]SIS89342.1 hypothetical protein SAMN05421580_106174 [Rhodobacter aestuarii]